MAYHNIKHSINNFISAEWGIWTAYGQCSLTCGGGKQYRERSCNGGSNCPGADKEEKSCNPHACRKLNNLKFHWKIWMCPFELIVISTRGDNIITTFYNKDDNVTENSIVTL